MPDISQNAIAATNGTGTAISLTPASNTCTANITNNLSNRNLIMNGSMQCSQRADLTASADGYGGVDRWYLYNAGDGRITVTQATDVPSTNEFKYSLKLDVTTADTAGASSRGWIGQWLEARDSGVTLKGTSAAKKVTVQFWVKSPKTGTHIVGLGDSNATTGSANSRFVNVTYTVSSANTWEKKTVTFPADTTGVFNTTTARGLWLGFRLVAGSNSTSGALATSWQDYAVANEGAGQVNVLDNTSNDFYLTGVQAELGDYSSDFDHKKYGDELKDCKRYFQTCRYAYYGVASTAGYFEGGNIMYPIEPRTSPTLAITAFNGSTRWTQATTGSTSTSILSFNVWSSPQSSGGNDGFQVEFSVEADL